MSFTRSKKVIHQQNKYLPPPGYYEPFQQVQRLNGYNFNRGQRFNSKLENFNPGPGSYNNNDKDIIKKRLLDQANKKQPFKTFGSSTKDQNQNDIKISSIPSIPKKSATRVYQQLAPGILILHQQQYQNTNIGPGSYDVNESQIKKKVLATKMQPQHKKRMPIIQEQQQIQIPTMAQQLRQQKRLLYKQNLYKSSNVNKNDINSSDLCLETIILRQKLLRGDQIPPPGYYYNEDIYSTFKKNDFQKPPELQALGGKEERFRENQIQNVGPGAYLIKQDLNKKGGVIGKTSKDDINLLKKKFQPGPGTYQFVSLKAVKQEPKGNYPPIFGSGTKRFASAPKQTTQQPGPGSYKIDKRHNKKVKYIKIRKDFYQSQPIEKSQLQFNNPLGFLNRTDDKQPKLSVQVKSRKQINNHYFKSKVDRFLSQKSQFGTGPGVYQVSESGFAKQTFNRTNQGYVGNKSQRFDDIKIRPNIGPGTYY